MRSREVSARSNFIKLSGNDHGGRAGGKGRQHWQLLKWLFSAFSGMDWLFERNIKGFADFHDVNLVCVQWLASNECLSVALQNRKHGSFSKWPKWVTMSCQLPRGKLYNLLITSHHYSEHFVLKYVEWTSSTRWEFYNNRMSHMQAKSQFATRRLLSSRRLWWTARSLENSRRAGWRDLSFAGWLRSVGEAEHNQLPERSPGQISVSTIIKWPYTCWE